MIRRYISTSPKRKLKNNNDVTDYFAETYEYDCMVIERALQ